MNQYGARAREHWEQHLPSRVAAMTDPEAFFEDLGEQVEEEIDQRARAIETQHAAEEPAGTSFLARAGQMGTARTVAEAEVLREMVLLAPETETDPGPEMTSG